MTKSCFIRLKAMFACGQGIIGIYCYRGETIKTEYTLQLCSLVTVAYTRNAAMP